MVGNASILLYVTSIIEKSDYIYSKLLGILLTLYFSVS